MVGKIVEAAAAHLCDCVVILLSFRVDDSEVIGIFILKNRLLDARLPHVQFDLAVRHAHQALLEDVVLSCSVGSPAILVELVGLFETPGVV